jgi:hypothetical protein
MRVLVLVVYMCNFVLFVDRKQEQEAEGQQQGGPSYLIGRREDHHQRSRLRQLHRRAMAGFQERKVNGYLYCFICVCICVSLGAVPNVFGGAAVVGW